MENSQFALEAFKNTQELIRFIDQKAGGVLVILGILATALLDTSKSLKFVTPSNATFQEAILFTIGMITAITLSITTWIVLFRILRPRSANHYTPTTTSPFYFGHVAALKDKDDLYNIINTASDAEHLRYISDQIFETSKILKSKISNLHISINFVAAALTSLIIFMLLARTA